jgi:hypothetical protein
MVDEAEATKPVEVLAEIQAAKERLGAATDQVLNGEITAREANVINAQERRRLARLTAVIGRLR